MKREKLRAKKILKVPMGIEPMLQEGSDFIEIKILCANLYTTGQKLNFSPAEYIPLPVNCKTGVFWPVSGQG
jgi:hypothetical protein